jgi:uncharacterized protein with von Willebrand factor type A (vWA) domain
MTTERDQNASQVSSLGAHASPRASGTDTSVDETVSLASELVSQYQELVAVMEAEKARLQAALAAAAARFREERRIHEGNTELAARIIEEQAQYIEGLEARLELEQSRTRDAEAARLFDGYLRDLRNGASFRETGARYYGMRPVGSRN